MRAKQRLGGGGGVMRAFAHNTRAFLAAAALLATASFFFAPAEAAPAIEHLVLMKMPTFGQPQEEAARPPESLELAAPLTPDVPTFSATTAMTNKGPVSPMALTAAAAPAGAGDLFASPLTPLSSDNDDGGASGRVRAGAPQEVDDGGASPQLQALDEPAPMARVGLQVQPRPEAQPAAQELRFRAAATDYASASAVLQAQAAAKAAAKAGAEAKASVVLFKAASTVEMTEEQREQATIAQRMRQHLQHQQMAQLQLQEQLRQQQQQQQQQQRQEPPYRGRRCRAPILPGRQQEAISLPNNTLPEANCTDPLPQELEAGVTAKLCNGLPCTDVLKPVSDLPPVRPVHGIDIDHDPLCKIEEYAKANEHCRLRGPLGRIPTSSVPTGAGSTGLPAPSGPVGRLNEGADPRSAYAFVDHLPGGPTPLGRLGYVHNISAKAQSPQWVSPAYLSDDGREIEEPARPFTPQAPRQNDPIGRLPTDPALRLDHNLPKPPPKVNASAPNKTDPTDVEPNDAVRWTSLARVMHIIDEKKRETRDDDPKLGFVHSDDRDFMNFAYSPYTRIAPLYRDGPDFNLNNALNHPEKLINDVGHKSDSNSTSLVNGTEDGSDGNNGSTGGIVNSDSDPVYHGSPVVEDVKKDQFGQVIPKIGWLPGKQGLISDVSNDEPVNAGFENWRKKLSLVPKQLPSSSNSDANSSETHVLVDGKPQQSVEEWQAEQRELEKEQLEREEGIVNYTTLAAPFMKENGRVILDTVNGSKLETPSQYFAKHKNESEFAQDLDGEALKYVEKVTGAGYRREDGGPPRRRGAGGRGTDSLTFNPSPSQVGGGSDESSSDQASEADREKQAKQIEEKLAQMQKAQQRIQEQVVKTHVRLHNVGMMHIRQRMDHQYAPFEKWEGDHHDATKYLDTMATRMADEADPNKRGKPRPSASQEDQESARQEKDLKQQMDVNDDKLIQKHQQIQKSILQMLQHMRERQAQVELNIADTQRRIHLLPMEHIRRRITDEYSDWGPKPRRMTELVRNGAPEKQAQFMNSLRSRLDPSRVRQQAAQLLQQMQALQAKTLTMHRNILATQRQMHNLFVKDLRKNLFSGNGAAEATEVDLA